MPCVFSMLLLDTPCRMFVFLLVVHCVLSIGIIKETVTTQITLNCEAAFNNL